MPMKEQVKTDDELKAREEPQTGLDSIMQPLDYESLQITVNESTKNFLKI